MLSPVQNVPMAAAAERKLRQGGLTGLALGAFVLMICELPVILTLVGLGALAAKASTLRPALWVEAFGLAAALLGTLVLIALVLRGTRKRE